MKQWRIDSERVRLFVAGEVMKIAPDGKTTIVIRGAGSKSARQRGLQWRLYTSIAGLSIGGHDDDDTLVDMDTKEGVHIFAKFLFARPIMIRDDPFWGDLWTMWRTAHPDREALFWFCDKHLSTEKFNVHQMAEYLTDFYTYWEISRGIQLPHPDDNLLTHSQEQRNE